MDLLDDDSRAVLSAALPRFAKTATAEADDKLLKLELGDKMVEMDEVDDVMAHDDDDDDDDDDILSQLSKSSRAASDVAPMEIDPELEPDSDQMLFDAEPASGDLWVPGENVEPWITQNKPAGKQAQVLIVNLFRSVQRLGAKTVKHILSLIMPEALLEKAKAAHKSLHVQLAAGLMRMSVSGVGRIVENVKAAGWQPYALKGKGKFSCAEAACPPASEHRDPDASIKNIVRIALSAAVEGRSFQEYVRDVQRFQLAGADVGNKYMDYRFARDVVAIASLVQQQIDALDWNCPLGGLGIPSDIGVLADPVSLGLSVRAKHDVLLVMCVSTVSHRTGKLVSSMHSAPAMQLGEKTGATMSAAILSGLEAHPASWGLHALRARCAAVSGDGQLCLGGPEHRHSSTAAAEKMWKRLHPNPGVAMCTVWDPFHRADNAAMRAIKAVPLASHVFEVAKSLENMFGSSEGVTLFRAVADHIGEMPRMIKAPGGTRKIVYLSGTPFSILENFQIIQAGLHARARWAQEGSSSYTVADVLAVARDLQEVSFIVFLLVFHDVLKGIFRPFAVMVQGLTEPSVLAAAQRRVVRELHAAESCIASLRRLVLVLTLCRQHAPGTDLSNLLAAYATTRAGRYFPQLFKDLSKILLNDAGPPLFKSCVLETKGALDICGDDWQCLGPHCQCLAREDLRGAGGRGVGKRGRELPRRLRFVL